MRGLVRALSCASCDHSHHLLKSCFACHEALSRVGAQILEVGGLEVVLENRDIGSRTDEMTELVIDDYNFVHRDPPIIAGFVAMRAAAPARQLLARLER